MRIGVFGAGGFGLEVMRYLDDQYQGLPRGFLELSFVEPKDGGIRQGRPVYSEADFLKHGRSAMFVVAISNATRRREVVSRCLDANLSSGHVGLNYVGILHNEIGYGIICCPGAIVTAGARVGDYVHLNIGSYIAHGCRVGDYVTLAPHACVNGNVILEDDVYVGTGAMIREGTPDKPVRIGKGAVIGMGAVVLGDVPAGGTVVGNPARLLDPRQDT